MNIKDPLELSNRKANKKHSHNKLVRQQKAKARKRK
jgi:hypothetical protein